MSQRIGGGDASDGADAIAGIDYFSFRVQDEVCGVEDLSPLLPIGADSIRVAGNFEAIGHRDGQLMLLHGFPGFFQGID